MKQALQKRIGVVGFGPTALSFFAQFLEGLETPGTYELHFFDPSPHGLGDAYRPQASTNLMNTSIEVTSLFENRPDDFLHWLNHSSCVWKDLFPGKKTFSGKEMVPRALFGRYLECRRAELMERASQIGLRVVEHPLNVIDLRRSGTAYVLVTESTELEVDAVLLFTGCFKRPLFPALRDTPGFIESVYEASDVLSRIDGDASVLVIGTKLSAIDALIQLAELCPKAKLAAASRTGELPAPNLAIDLRRERANGFLNRDAFDSLRAQAPSRPVDDILYELTRNSLREVGCEWKLEDFLEQDPTERFHRQVEGLGSGRAAYESLILPLAQLLENVWWDLSEPERARVRTRYLRVIMHYVGAFPIENARKVLTLLHDGRVRLLGGLKSVESLPSGFEARFEKLPAEAFDVVVDCSGYDNGLASPELSPVMGRIVERKLFQLNSAGGFQIDRDYRLRDPEGNPLPVFAAGFPIKGSVPFANWFNRIVLGTHRIASILKGESRVEV